ncbi:hypothetical protein LA080_003908 [Diaporthe eres]|nr:hypothetical protein LA080_003908 [Diaporthe eres]
MAEHPWSARADLAITKGLDRSIWLRKGKPRHHRARLPDTQQRRRPVTGSPENWVGAVVLARSKSPRAPAVEHQPVSGQHELNWLSPVDPLVRRGQTVRAEPVAPALSVLAGSGAGLVFHTTANANQGGFITLYGHLRREVSTAVGITKLACLMMPRWVYWGVGSLAVVMAEVTSLMPLPAVRVPSRDAVTGRDRIVQGQVGRQADAHVSRGEGIVTTRPCDGNKSWADDDSVVVTN